MKVVIDVKEDHQNVFRRELGTILSEVAKGLLTIPFPPERPNKWTHCPHCGRWIKL